MLATSLTLTEWHILFGKVRHVATLWTVDLLIHYIKYVLRTLSDRKMLRSWIVFAVFTVAAVALQKRNFKSSSRVIQLPHFFAQLYILKYKNPSINKRSAEQELQDYIEV